MTAITPRMATRQPAQGQIAAGRRAMLLEGFKRVGGAGRLETAGRAYPRAQGQAVQPYQPHEQVAHHGATGGAAAGAGADWRRTA